jgi:hypothetical protein
MQKWVWTSAWKETPVRSALLYIKNKNLHLRVGIQEGKDTEVIRKPEERQRNKLATVILSPYIERLHGRLPPYGKPMEHFKKCFIFK